MTLHPAPQFVPALRGYDRFQVDGYVATLSEQLEEGRERVRAAEERAALAERRAAELEADKGRRARPAEHAPDRVGERLTQILQLASDEADHMRAAAGTAAKETLSEARMKAGRILAAAEHRTAESERERRRGQQALQEESARILAEARRAADDLLSKAATEAGRITAEAERQRSAERSVLSGLQGSRDRLLAELDRLRAALSTLDDALPPEGS
jgi:cell division septum initiation protein DivIVA